MTVKFFASFLLVSITVFFLFFNSREPAKMSDELATASKFGIGNNAVYMAGCQTYHKPVPPKVIYKTVRRNFVTLPCALEVPPPGGVIELQKYFALK